MLQQALFIRQVSKQAEARGEVFHALERFIPLSSPLAKGTEAYAIIQRVMLEDKNPKLILRLRQPTCAPNEELCNTIARLFFKEGCTRLPTPVQSSHGVEWIFHTDYPEKTSATKGY